MMRNPLRSAIVLSVLCSTALGDYGAVDQLPSTAVASDEDQNLRRKNTRKSSSYSDEVIDDIPIDKNMNRGLWNRLRKKHIIVEIIGDDDLGRRNDDEELAAPILEGEQQHEGGEDHEEEEAAEVDEGDGIDAESTSSEYEYYYYFYYEDDPEADKDPGTANGTVATNTSNLNNTSTKDGTDEDAPGNHEGSKISLRHSPQSPSPNQQNKNTLKCLSRTFGRKKGKSNKNTSPKNSYYYPKAVKSDKSSGYYNTQGPTASKKVTCVPTATPTKTPSVPNGMLTTSPIVNCDFQADLNCPRPSPSTITGPSVPTVPTTPDGGGTVPITSNPDVINPSEPSPPSNPSNDPIVPQKPSSPSKPSPPSKPSSPNGNNNDNVSPRPPSPSINNPNQPNDSDNDNFCNGLDCPRATRPTS